MSMVERIPSRIFIGPEPEKAGERPPWFLDPREVLRALRPRWPIVLAPALLLTLAMAVWQATAPSLYTASTQILIDPRALQVVKDGVSPADQASDASLLLIDSQVRVIVSDDILGRVVAAYRLDRAPELNRPPSGLAALKARLTALIRTPAPPPDPKLLALRSLRERTTARRMDRSFVVDVAVTGDSPESAAELARAVATTYLAAAAETQAQIARKAGAALSGRLGELQEALREAEDRAQQFRAANNIVGTRAQLVSEQQLTQLNQQLGAARARVGELRGRLGQIEALSGGPLDRDAVSEVVRSPAILQLRGQLAQIESTQADAVAHLGPRHPMLRTGAQQVRSLRAQIDAEIKRTAASVQHDYRSAVASEAALSATLEGRKAEALAVDKSFVRLRELERQVEASRAVYEAFLVRARELQQQQRLDTSTSRIISPASLPARRNGPPPAAVVGAAALAGLGLGVALALLAVPVTGRLGSRRRLEHATGLPVAAALPDARGNDRAYEVAVARLGSRLQRDLGGLKTAIVLVTSADDRDGKSELARRLAVSAARDGQRVMLVDADPEARLTRDVGPAQAPSPPEAGRTRSPLEEALVEMPGGVRLLSCDVGGSGPGTAALAGAILAAAEAFDAVFVDIGLVGTDVAAERLAQDARFPALLITASALRSHLPRLRRALDAVGREPRLRLVMTDATDGE